MCYSLYPNPLGQTIQKLQIGDEVTVITHENLEVTGVVVALEGFSDLLNDGTVISCRHTISLRKIGHKDRGEYEISPKAKEMMAQTEEAKAKRDAYEVALRAELEDGDYFNTADPFDLL